MGSSICTHKGSKGAGYGAREGYPPEGDRERRLPQRLRVSHYCGEAIEGSTIMHLEKFDLLTSDNLEGAKGIQDELQGSF